MAEVDEIILYGLRSIGCELASSTSTLADFDSQLFYKSCLACLKLIQPGLEDLPLTLPGPTASKFKACTALSKAIQESGYTDEVGFNSFMYTSVDNVRKVLSFLINKLPTGDEGAGETAAAVSVGLYSKALAAVEELYQQTSQKKTRALKQITREFASTFQLAGLRPLHQHIVIPFLAPSSEEETSYVTEKVDFVPAQVLDRRDFPISVLEYNQSRIGKEKSDEAAWVQSGIHSGLSRKQWQNSLSEKLKQELRAALHSATQRYDPVATSKLFASMAVGNETSVQQNKSRFMKELTFAKTDEDSSKVVLEERPKISEEELAAQRRQQKEQEEGQLREEAQKLEQRLAKVSKQYNELLEQTEKAKNDVIAVQERTKDLGEEGKELEAAYETQQKTNEYANDLPGNRAKLEAIANGIRQEIEKAQEQHNEKEAKYKSQYDSITYEQEKAKRELQAKLDEIQVFKQKLKLMVIEIKEKEEQKEALEQEYAKLPKDIDRDLFIRRIMDIIKNIKKQQLEITKINIDNKELQKEINQANDAVTRSFIATEEKVYKDATKDDVAKKVYKQLVALRENFEVLIGAVEETGQIKQQSHELEEKQSSMSQRNDDLNTERLQSDLENIKAENNQLSAELKDLKKK